jgi:hypothetical protein
MIRKISIALGIGIALAFLVLFLPVIQAAGYALLISNPSLIYWLLIGGVMGTILYGLNIIGVNPFISIIAFSLFMGLIVGPFISGVYAHEHVAEEIESSNPEIENLPSSTNESARILPRSVADKYSRSSMQKPQYQLGESDITRVNGTYRWSYPVKPDNIAVALLGEQNGAMYTNMGTMSKDTDIRENSFENGRGQLLIDSYTYQSILKTPLKEHNFDTTFNTRHDGKSYIIHSTTVHKWEFRFLPIPHVYSVPRHGSVEIMDRDGHINSVSPEKARDVDALEGENFYPYHLSKFKINSMKYKNGYINYAFVKEDVLQITELPEEGNSWPLVVPLNKTDPQLQYIIATEPAGSGSGVFEVWVIDGQTGEASVKNFEEAQIGPERAVEFVSRQPDVNRLSSSRQIAPIPTVINGSLNWHIKVVPNSETGVIYTAFVNSKSGNVVLYDDTPSVYSHLEGNQEQFRNQSKLAKSSSDGQPVRIVVTGRDGTVTRTSNISVPEGGSIKFDIGDTENSSAP